MTKGHPTDDDNRDGKSRLPTVIITDQPFDWSTLPFPVDVQTWEEHLRCSWPGCTEHQELPTTRCCTFHTLMASTIPDEGPSS